MVHALALLPPILDVLAKVLDGHHVVCGLHMCVSAIDTISNLASYVHPGHFIQFTESLVILLKLRHLGFNLLEGGKSCVQ